MEFNGLAVKLQVSYIDLLSKDYSNLINCID